MRLALQTVAYYTANVLSFTAYAIGACLAFAVGTDETTLATTLLAIGIFSLGFDGIFAKWSGSKAEPGSFTDTVCTAGSSLTLTFGSLYWLVRADFVPWWSLIILAALTFGPELLYVGPHKSQKRPFVPVVLFGSLAYWVGALCIYAEMADLPAYIAPLGLYVYGLIYLRLHLERLMFFRAEADALL